jgi:hypothetical protein
MWASTSVLENIQHTMLILPTHNPPNWTFNGVCHGQYKMLLLSTHTPHVDLEKPANKTAFSTFTKNLHIHLLHNRCYSPWAASTHQPGDQAASST